MRTSSEPLTPVAVRPTACRRAAGEVGWHQPVPEGERVDVRGVEQRESARQTRGGLDPQRGPVLLLALAEPVAVVAEAGIRGLLRGQPDPGQLRQYAYPGEPA